MRVCTWKITREIFSHAHQCCSPDLAQNLENLYWKLKLKQLIQPVTPEILLHYSLAQGINTIYLFCFTIYSMLNCYAALRNGRDNTQYNKLFLSQWQKTCFACKTVPVLSVKAGLEETSLSETLENYWQPIKTSQIDRIQISLIYIYSTHRNEAQLRKQLVESEMSLIISKASSGAQTWHYGGLIGSVCIGVKPYTAFVFCKWYTLYQPHCFTGWALEPAWCSG